MLILPSLEKKIFFMKSKKKFKLYTSTGSYFTLFNTSCPKSIPPPPPTPKPIYFPQKGQDPFNSFQKYFDRERD